MTTWCAFVYIDHSLEDDTGLDNGGLEVFKGLVSDRFALGYTLNGPGGISQDNEVNLVRATGTIDPAFQLDFLAIVHTRLNFANPMRLLQIHLLRSCPHQLSTSNIWDDAVEWFIQSSQLETSQG